MEPRNFVKNAKFQKAHFSCFSELQGQVYWMAAFATATPLRKIFFDYGYSALTMRSQFLDDKFPKNAKILNLTRNFA